MTGRPAPSAPRPIASGRHTLILVAILVAVTFVMAAEVRRPEAAAGQSHVPRYLVLAVSEWLLALYAANGIRASGTPLREILGIRWRSARAGAATLLWAAGFWLVKSVVLFFIARGVALAGLASAVEDQRTMRVMAPHGALEAALWIIVSASAGVCEEFVFRGYLQRQLGALVRSPGLGLVASATIFGLGHLYQGPGPVITITVFGLLFGGLAMASRSLAPGIVVHAVQDAIAGLTHG